MDGRRRTDANRSGHRTRLTGRLQGHPDRKSTRLNSSHSQISYAVFCLKKKKKIATTKNHGMTITFLPDLLIVNKLDCCAEILLQLLLEFACLSTSLCILSISHYDIIDL